MSERWQGSGLSDLVPLPERIASTTALRACLVVAPLLLAPLLSNQLTVTWQVLAAIAGAYLALAVVMNVLGRLGRQAAIWTLSLGMLTDGVYLGWLLVAFGGLSGPTPFLVALHVLGVTLLASFRSGVKLTLWHSLVALTVLEATSLGMFGDPLTPFPAQDFTLYLAPLWTLALATASFAAVNERELRRRRYDAEVLQRFAGTAEDVQDVPALLAGLALLAVQDLQALRAVAAVLPTSNAVLDETSLRDCAVAHHTTDAVTAVRVPADVLDDLGPLSALAPALATRSPVLAAALSEEDDVWLADVLPDAERVIVVPFGLQDGLVGVLVMECSRSGLPWAPDTVERRLLATATQATAHAGQALSRLLLIGRLRDAAQRDGLTGIANRRTLDAAIDAATQRWHSTMEPFGLLLLDLDHFKALNDTYGHQAGDAVLRDVAAHLRVTLPEGVLLARYGGEEFAVLLPGADEAAAHEIGEQVRATIEATTTAAPVTASVGIGLAPLHGSDAVDLLRAADEALYIAKHDGRNCVRLGVLADPVTIAAQRTGEVEVPVS